MAKRDLKAGERLDGVGGFTCYGLTDNATTARSIDALPFSFSEGCVLRRDMKKDEVISFADVQQPARGMADRLWAEQMERWPIAQPLAVK
jgi:predicted homoserine dehydrogenase-like protein